MEFMIKVAVTFVLVVIAVPLGWRLMQTGDANGWPLINSG